MRFYRVMCLYWGVWVVLYRLEFGVEPRVESVLISVTRDLRNHNFGSRKKASSSRQLPCLGYTAVHGESRALATVVARALHSRREQRASRGAAGATQ